MSRHPATPIRSCASACLATFAAALLAHPHIDPHRAALEPECLAQPPFQEPTVSGLEKTRREQNECRWSRGGLGGEQDARLLATANRWRRGRHPFFDPGVQRAGGDPGVP